MEMITDNNIRPKKLWINVLWLPYLGLELLKSILIGLYILVVVFGVLGGIGWVTLADEIKPLRLRDYLLYIITAIIKYWFSKEFIESHPIYDPKQKSNEGEQTFHPRETRPLRPVIRPDVSSNRGATDKHDKPDNPV